MGYADYLRELLRPLGVYDLEGGRFSPAELTAQGSALDGCGARLDQVEREMLLCTAEDTGLTAIETLLPRRPVAETVQQRRTALAALLRIGGDSFTLRAINDNLTGCGINALASETETPNRVKIVFPDVAGEPDGYEELKKIIEDILPCHLGIEYVFWYVTWAMIGEKFSKWDDLESEGYTWAELEKLVR